MQNFELVYHCMFNWLLCMVQKLVLKPIKIINKSIDNIYHSTHEFAHSLNENYVKGKGVRSLISLFELSEY